MSKKKALILILLTFELAVIVPLGLSFWPVEPQVRRISVNAQRYGYSPGRIKVNKGDTVIVSLSSRDVSHGFDLDGYPVKLIAQKGVMFQKNLWAAESADHKTLWNRVSSVKFVANRRGKFIFRCTQTCGNLHPFMSGELVVGPNTPYHLFISLSIWLLAAVFIWTAVQIQTPFSGFKHRNLLEIFPRLKRLVFRRSFQFLIILPNFIIFYLFILSALWGSPVGNRNITIVFVWILWWFVLKAVMVPLGGRIWCLMCPLPAPAEWLSRRSLAGVRYLEKPLKRLHHRFSGLQKDWPAGLRNIWLQNILFLALISFGMILITRPLATAIVFILILALTLLLALVYRQRVFCLYLCPVGGFLSTYSMAAMTEVRAVDPKICIQHKQKECLTGGPDGWACPWNQYVGKMGRNNYCGLCTECIKSCPKENVGIFFRPFGSDRRLKDYAEMFNVIIMLVVALAFSITMAGPWGFIRDAANVTETGQYANFLAYLGVIWVSALVIFPALFAIVAWAAAAVAGAEVSRRKLMLRCAYIFVPVGIFAWIAFSLPMVMINYGYIFSVFSDPLGLGWDLLGTAHQHYAALIPEWIPVFQGLILLAGLYLGLSRGYLALADLFADRQSRRKALVLPALLAFGVVNLFLRLYLG